MEELVFTVSYDSPLFASLPLRLSPSLPLSLFASLPLCLSPSSPLSLFTSLPLHHDSRLSLSLIMRLYTCDADLEKASSAIEAYR